MLARALRHQQTIGRSVCQITASTRCVPTLRLSNLVRHTGNPRTFTSWSFVSQQKQSSESRSTNQLAVPAAHTTGEPRKRSLALPWMVKSEDASPLVPDPLLAAQHVAMLLSKDRVEDAQTFTRAASKHAQVIVSWNHLIGYALGNQKLREALKLFQEMKKRAQVPNAQTFTILFRGLAQSNHPKTAVNEAVKLYQSMLTRERVQPNVIHLNAVLKVCAAAGDLESLFTIVESANDSARSPDGQTYTIILNGLRAPLVDRQRQPSYDEQLRNAEEAATKEAIQRAKTMWREVIERWRAGAIVIDEALVCAMGRILILGGPADSKSVVELIEQTMNISAKPQEEQGQVAQPIDVSSVQASTTKSIMSPAQASPRKPGSSTGFATPGNNSLSLVLEALTQSGQTSPALSYWDVFVNKHGVKPDTQNWTALLHAFSKGRSSNSAANALDKIPADILQTKHVRAAMKACLRDMHNKNAFDNATRILKSMTTKLVLPDIAAMQIYLRVADASKKPFENKEGFFDEKAKYAHGRQLGAAVNNLQEPHAILRQHVDSLKLDSIADSKEWLQKSALLQDLVAVSRTMYATYDRLIFDKLVPDKVAEAIKPLRNQLNRVIQGYFDERVKRDPAFDRKAAEKGETGQNAPVRKPREEVKQWPQDAEMPHGFSQRKGKHYSGMHQIAFKKPEQFEENAKVTQLDRSRRKPAWGDIESSWSQGQRRERSHARGPPRQTTRSPNRRDQVNIRDRGPRRDGQVWSKEEFWAMTG